MRKTMAIASPAPRRNVELKARLAALEPVRKIAQRLATERLPDQHQVDTYFVCPNGRLKLREIDDRQAQLVWYDRPDRRDAKSCSYHLVPVADPAALKEALTRALGVRIVVEKHRAIDLCHNVRIHLDRVVELGVFLEFEAVLGPEHDEADGQAKIAGLRAQMHLAEGDLLEGSYADLLEAR